MNHYNYLIILLISIIICYLVYINYNKKEKFSSSITFDSIDDINPECPVGDIVYGFCNTLCNPVFYQNDPESKAYCDEKCPLAVKNYLIDNPHGFTNNYFIKQFYKGELTKSKKQLDEVQKYLIQQTDIALAIQELSNPGSKWKEIEITESELDQTKNIKLYIENNDESTFQKQEKLRILTKLKESILNGITTFTYISEPTFKEIQSI